MSNLTYPEARKFLDEIKSSVEKKAANLLYFVVKNHPFYDGNKRSAAAHSQQSFSWLRYHILTNTIYDFTD